MNLKGFFVFLVTLTLVSSCSFVPKASENQEYFAECPMLTKQLTLSVTELEGGVCDDDDDLEACLLTLGVVVPVGTLVLSGSIVVAGNTLHWLEYEATCENGAVLRNYNKLKNKLSKT